jgi:hypothetical protein
MMTKDRQHKGGARRPNRALKTVERLVTLDVASILATVLEKVALGAQDSEIAALINPARDASAWDLERLHFHLSTIAQLVRDRGSSERSLNLLIDTARDLSSTLSLQDLLHTIVSRARGLVSANVAWLTLIDESGNRLRTVTAEGNVTPATSEMSARVGDGAVSLIVSSRTFFDTQNYHGDQRFRHSDSLDRILRAENIVSLAGFPILANDELQGVLFVADRYGRKLSEREISVLGSFALHAGVAMRNAHTFAMLSEALAEADRNRSKLIDHIQRVDASAAAHDEMTSLLAKGTEWPLFIQRMADQINGAIILYDESLSIKRRFNSTPFREQMDADEHGSKISSPLLISAISESRRIGRSVAMLEVDGEQYRAMALHGGAGQGESLVICHHGHLDPIDIRNLERNAVALSIAKLWSEKRETEQLIASTTLVRHLVRVNPPDASTISAVRDRLKTDQPIMLALIAIVGLDRASQTAMIRETASKTNLLIDLMDDAYLAAGPAKSIRLLIQTLLRHRKGWEAGGIVSDPFSDLTQAPVHYEQIEKALRVLRKMNRFNQFVDHSQVNLFAKLFEVGDASRIGRYLVEILSPIDEYDPDQKRHLKKTLLCYIDNQYNIARTAERLGVHVNTVRQRLDTLRDITGGWEDPISALELHMALRLDEIIATP